MFRFLLLHAALLFSVSLAVPATAAVVTSELNLVPVDSSDTVAGDNELAISFEGFGSVISELSGRMTVDLDLDLQGNVSGFAISGGSFTGTPWTFGTLEASESSGIFRTPDSGLMTVTNGSFDATRHEVVTTEGTVSKEGTVRADFSNSPLPIPGVGTGALTLTPSGGNQFDVRLELPVEVKNLVLDPDQPDTSTTIAGTVAAVGSVTAIPEPSSVLFLSMIGFANVLGLRRRPRRVETPKSNA